MKRLVAIAVATAVAVALVAYSLYRSIAVAPPLIDAMWRFTLVNETDQPLQFYWSVPNGATVKDALVLAHSEAPSTCREVKTTVRVVARRQDGRIVFDQTYTNPDLDKVGSRVIVSSTAPIE